MRRIAIFVLVCLLAASASGTGAFTSMNAERGVTVAVAEDGDAFLGLEAAPLDRCGDLRLYRVTNRLPGATFADVAVEVVATEGVRATVTETPAHLSPGERGEVRVRVTPETPATTDVPGSLTVALTATGPDVRVSLERTHEVSCVPRNGGGDEENGHEGENGNDGDGEGDEENGTQDAGDD